MTNETFTIGDEPRDERPAREDRPHRDERAERMGRDDRDARDSRDDRGDREVGRTAIDMFFSGQQRTQFGGISNKMLNTLVEVFEAVDGSYDDPSTDPQLARKNFKISPIESGTNPTLVIGLPCSIGATSAVIYYSLVLEDPQQQMREVRIGRGYDHTGLQLPVFTEDRMDKRWQASVHNAVTRIGTGKPIQAGWQLIPASLLTEDASDKAIREAIENIYSNAVDAICAWREVIAEQMGVNVPMVRITPEFVSKTQRFEVSLDISRKPKLDTAGQPIRSDIALTVYHAQIPDRDSDGTVPTRRQIGTVSVAVDLHVDDGAENSGWVSRNREEDQPFWQPVINITEMTGAPGIPWSLENSLLMLGASSVLSSDFRWVEGLRGGGNRQFKSLEDLSTLMLAHPDPEMRVVTDIPNNVSDAELSEYLNLTVKPDVFYGMMIPAGSEKSWANQIFERIALGDSDASANARDSLYAAANRLTGNKFSSVMREMGIEATAMPVHALDSKIFTGHFSDDQGNLRDIREWNVPAILTLNKSDPINALETAMDYQDTLMSAGDVELQHDLAVRYNILERAFGGSNFHTNGTVEVIQLRDWFIEVLCTAMAESGVLPHNSDHTGLRARVHRQAGYVGERIRNLSYGGRIRDRDDDFRRRGPYGGDRR